MGNDAAYGQPYRYPVFRTGTSQDLLLILTRAAELVLAREKITLPRKSPAQRRWLEAPFVAIGAALAAVLERLPSDFVLRLHDKVFRALSGKGDYPFEGSSPVLLRAQVLADKARARTGVAPALLALISHPPVMGEMAHLNFQLVRHASLALRAVRRTPCRPRLVVATDLFSLDTISLVQEGLYAGMMGRYHLGFDRLSVGKRSASAWLLRRTAWPLIAHRLFSNLRAGGAAGMVLAGGVPSTTRVLFAVREWAARQRRLGLIEIRPQELLRRFRRSPVFSKFESAWGANRPWRTAQAYVMTAAAGVLDQAGSRAAAAAESGRMTAELSAAAAEYLEAFGIEGAARLGALEELSREIERETPFRARFLRALVGRVLKKGRPVVILPVVHRRNGTLSIEEREAWAWMKISGGKIEAEDGQGRSWQGSPEEFSVLLGRENFG